MTDQETKEYVSRQKDLLNLKLSMYDASKDPLFIAQIVEIFSEIVRFGAIEEDTFNQVNELLIESFEYTIDDDLYMAFNDYLHAYSANYEINKKMLEALEKFYDNILLTEDRYYNRYRILISIIDVIRFDLSNSNPEKLNQIFESFLLKIKKSYRKKKSGGLLMVNVDLYTKYAAYNPSRREEIFEEAFKLLHKNANHFTETTTYQFRDISYYLYTLKFSRREKKKYLKYMMLDMPKKAKKALLKSLN